MIGFERHGRALEVLKSRGRLRVLTPRAGHDFASNDYLGFAASDFLRAAAQDALERGVAVGSGGSRLLRGNTDEHEQLEAEAAAFFNSERALFLGSGYVANTAIFSSLPAPGDLVLHDALIHASAHDGMRLGRADACAFAHNDVSAAEAQIAQWRGRGGRGRIWLAVESLYGMDGDLAPLDDLAALAGRHEAILIVDEAHATGVFGDCGRGLAQRIEGHGPLLTLHTCGKALGVSGGLVCGAAPLIETLINRARGFIFATAPSPLNAALVRAALRQLQISPDRQDRLQSLVAQAHGLAVKCCGLTGLSSQIIPVIIGGDKATMALAARLQRRGFDIRGIRPPTVPRGTSRLRIAITLNISADILADMFAALGQELEAAA